MQNLLASALRCGPARAVLPGLPAQRFASRRRPRIEGTKASTSLARKLRALGDVDRPSAARALLVEAAAAAAAGGEELPASDLAMVMHQQVDRAGAKAVMAVAGRPGAAAADEAVYSGYVARLASGGELQQCCAALRDMEASGVRPKLRTFAHVLDACGAAPATPPPPDAATAAAAAAPLGAATVLWRHMLGSEVRPTERELVSLAEAAARHAEAGGALERAAAAAALSSALRDAARCLRQVGIVDAAFDLSPPAAAAVADAARRVGAADATAEARVDGGTAACGACGGYLSAARLSEADAAAARGRLLGAAEQARPGFAIELERMCKWIDSRGFTVLIDGPNLAYAGQNSPLGGRFSVAQIDAAVGALKAHGETPLVILPGRYKGPQIRNSARLPNEYLETQKHHRGEGGEWRMTAYTPKERATLVDWAANGEVSWVRSTPGHFDDWVWMLSTISDAANASRPDRVAERPVRALTNDLCLDHRNLEYFAPRAFSQWANERLIRYSVVNPEKADGAVPRGTLPSVLLARPPAAGAEVQRCDAGEWHAPVAGSTAWLCTTGLAAAAGDGGDAAVDALGGPWKGLLGT